MPAVFVVRPPRRAFTLIELLAVLAILGVLTALLLGGLRNFSAKSQSLKCASNLRQIYLAAESYSQENNGKLVPGSRSGNSEFWLYLLRPYLGGKDMWDTSVDNRVRCPTPKSNYKNYWAWNYGMNARPGFEGTSSSTYDKLFAWEPLQRPFQTVGITHKSRRLFVCDANEWQVQAGASATSVASFPEYNRHGQGKCNVLFYDGHVESLNSAQINQALFNPGNQ